MKKISAKAYAKINLFLEVTSKREDGYHNIQTIMQTIAIYDELEIENINTDEIVFCCKNAPTVPSGEKNIVYKAARLLKDTFGIKEGLKISLKKNIPAGAGLGGGSSDAAETIKSFVKLFDIKDSKITRQKCLKIATTLGADVPFFLTGSTALCEGIGDIVFPLKNLKKQHIILLNPNIEIPTHSVFRRLKFPLTKGGVIHKIAALISDGKFNKNSGFDVLFNRLEEFVFPYYPEILRMKTILSQLGCASLMSGSGATVFGIADSQAHLEYVKSNLKNFPWKIWLTSSISKKSAANNLL
ncbi:MAG: 4-(cytidine 5'-diphospho)-2-C-methyl-D-erythritol kinase [Elusimicrobiota bacterium]|jgi:4-diphosphocytidyl-2-C-methyl-D-erythritol kinase|nr:4-(cytidine 5'-diphospho)-2-C-methyl-D-erythritol kinase [Elusimicrobiota bacterium]